MQAFKKAPPGVMTDTPLHIYFCAITTLPDKVYKVNPSIDINRDKFVYFVAASNEKDAQELTLCFFKEEYRLYTGHNEISLYVEEVGFETYRCPLVVEDIDEKRHRMTLTATKNKFEYTDHTKAVACAS